MKKILTVVLAAIMLAVGVNAAFERVNTYSNNFSDVTEANWFYDNVKTAYELGFMNGKSDGIFDPNGNVTVVEGITMATRIHAMYNGTEVKKNEKGVSEYRIDFDDPSYLVDLSQRNSRNTNGVNPYKATAKIEDGVLIVQAVQTDGRYDPQLQFNGLELAAKDYDKVTVRMKRDPLDDDKRDDYIEFFFTTNNKPAISADRQININYYKLQNLDDWFEISQDVGKHSQWTDIITGFRFDPSNDNGIYYIDYIVFSKSENIQNEKWYDMYVDYAIENDIIKMDTFKTAEYTRNITRAELCELIARAIPEEQFTPINDVKGIPDVLRDEKNADVFLMLYKAGIVLGDAQGNFNPKADIKRSEVAAIINRVALPENRVKGTVAADWDTQGNEYDIEFNDDSWLERLKFEANSVKIENGALVLESLDKGAGQPSRFDSKITFSGVQIDAAENTKLKVRFKAELAGESGNTQFDLYFGTEEDPGYNEAKSVHSDMFGNSYVDAAGWYVLEYDLAANARW
ncbi:MAG: S-layer homology domain-containing protein, partial [Clostridia bacterium]|nr:S-layer homology domain-containing protein [Clostridia bacterium]